MKVAVFGGPGGGEIVAQSILRAERMNSELQFVGYLNDHLPVGHGLLGGAVLGGFGDWKALPEETVFVAPLHKAKAMPERLQRLRALAPGRRWATVVDPAAVVAESATLSDGCMVGPFAVVGPSCELGPHVACWPAAQVGHDAALSAFVFVGRGAVISGYCRIGSGAYIGTGAVVREHCVVGAFAIVGAGAVVVSDVPEGAVVVGNPARPMIPR